MAEPTEQEKNELAANCNRFETLKHSTVNPAAFTEYGAVMLASVLKHDSDIRELVRDIRRLTVERTGKS